MSIKSVKIGVRIIRTLTESLVQTDLMIRMFCTSFAYHVFIMFGDTPYTWFYAKYNLASSEIITRETPRFVLKY